MARRINRQMPDKVKETYEEVNYSSSAFPKTAIASLAARARLWGLEPVPLTQARVLELGCSFGGNIISQALYHPNTSFLGIDLSSKQVEEGMTLIKQMGLSNVRLEEKNILDIDESFGTFDYIIVHGIWSWVPDEVKNKILSICNVNLSDRGVAYVSYNTYPGWKRLEQFRDIMLYATDKKPDMSLADRTIYGKQVLDLLGKTMGLDAGVRTNQAYKIDNIQTILKANNYYVSHEYFEIFNDPVYFHEFVRRAQEQGCAYIGDSTMALSYSSWLPNQIHANITHLADGDYIAKEQYIDYVYDTQFRCSLLTKGSNEDKIFRNETTNIDILKELYFLSHDSKGIPDDLTNTLYRSLKEVMDRGRVFQLQDVIDYIQCTYPGISISMDVLVERIFYLIITSKLDIFTEVVEQLDFEDYVTYIPECFINYVRVLQEEGGKEYIHFADSVNNSLLHIDAGLLEVMKLMAQVTTRDALLAYIREHMTITRTTADGLAYQVLPEQYLEECLTTLAKLGYFAR